MANRQVTLLRTDDDLQWLKDVHLKGCGTPPFGMALIYGNEDCPQRIELFDKAHPRYDEKPIAAYELADDLSYVLEGSHGER